MSSKLLIPQDVDYDAIIGVCFVLAGRLDDPSGISSRGSWVCVPDASEYWSKKGEADKILVVLVTHSGDRQVELPQGTNYASKHCAVLHVQRDNQTGRLLPGLRRLAALSMCNGLLRKFPSLQFMMCEDDNIRGRAGQIPTHEVLRNLVAEDSPAIMVRREYGPGAFPQDFRFPPDNKKKKMFHSGKSFALNRSAVQRLAEVEHAKLYELVPVHPSLVWEDAWTLLMAALDTGLGIPVIEAGMYCRCRKNAGAAQKAMQAATVILSAKEADNFDADDDEHTQQRLGDACGLKENKKKNAFIHWFEIDKRDHSAFLSQDDRQCHILVGQHMKRDYEQKLKQSLEKHDSEPTPVPPPPRPIPPRPRLAPKPLPRKVPRPWWQGQAEMATVIVKRIEEIVGPLEGHTVFKKTDFRLVIPPARSILAQTAQRLVEATAPGFGLLLGNVPAKEKILRFGSGFKSDEFYAYKDAVIKNPDTLYIMLVDECHVEMGPGEPHDQMVNDPELIAATNLIILLVSATPYAHGYTTEEKGSSVGKVQLYARTRMCIDNVLPWQPQLLERKGGEYGYAYFGLKHFLQDLKGGGSKIRKDARLESLIDNNNVHNAHNVFAADYVCAFLSAACANNGYTKSQCNEYVVAQTGFPALQDHWEGWDGTGGDTSQTAVLVNDLVNIDPSDRRGRLKIIRVGSGDMASVLHKHLKNVCDFTCFSQDIAVILDISDTGHWWESLSDTLRSRMCSWREDWKRKSPVKEDLTYGDLAHLPAILILVEKGKLGDTFPRDCIDQRLRKRGQEKYTLAELRQELARAACRYGHIEQVPYILVPASLYAKLEHCAHKFGDLVECRTEGLSWDTTRLQGINKPTPTAKGNYNFDFCKKILALKQNGESIGQLDGGERDDSIEVESEGWAIDPNSVVVWERLGLRCEWVNRTRFKIIGLKQLECQDIASPRCILIPAPEQGGKSGLMFSVIAQIQQKFTCKQPPRVEIIRSQIKLTWKHWQHWPNVWQQLDVKKLSGRLPRKKVLLMSGIEIQLDALAERTHAHIDTASFDIETSDQTSEVINVEYLPPGECHARNFEQTDESQLLELRRPKLGRLVIPSSRTQPCTQSLVVSIPDNRFIRVGKDGSVEKTGQTPDVVHDLIFRPSFDRCDCGLFNWWEMGFPTAEHVDVATYMDGLLQLIVVGPGGRSNPDDTFTVEDDGQLYEIGAEFDSYRKRWGRTHCIVQLRDGAKSMEYACAWIFDIARALHLSKVWIVPDDVSCFHRMVPDGTTIPKSVNFKLMSAPIVLANLAKQYALSASDLGPHATEQAALELVDQSNRRCAISGIPAYDSLKTFQPKVPFVKGSPQILLLNVEMLDRIEGCRYNPNPHPDEWRWGQDVFALQCSMQCNRLGQDLMVFAHNMFVAETKKMTGGHLSLVKSKPIVKSIHPALVPTDSWCEVTLTGQGLSLATKIRIAGVDLPITRQCDEQVQCSVSAGSLAPGQHSIVVAWTDVRGATCDAVTGKVLTMFVPPTLHSAKLGLNNELEICGQNFPAATKTLRVRLHLNGQYWECRAHRRSNASAYCTPNEMDKSLAGGSVGEASVEFSVNGVHFSQAGTIHWGGVSVAEQEAALGIFVHEALAEYDELVPTDITDTLLEHSYASLSQLYTQLYDTNCDVLARSKAIDDFKSVLKKSCWLKEGQLNKLMQEIESWGKMQTKPKGRNSGKRKESSGSKAPPAKRVKAKQGGLEAREGVGGAKGGPSVKRLKVSAGAGEGVAGQQQHKVHNLASKLATKGEQQVAPAAPRTDMRTRVFDWLAITFGEHADAKTAESRAGQLEDAMDAHASGVELQYKNKYRELRFNLSRNVFLRERLLDGSLTPHDLCQMDPKDMKNIR